MYLVSCGRGLYKSDPIALINHIMEYKGSGGAFALLQAKGWVTGVNAGTRVTFTDFNLYEASVRMSGDHAVVLVVTRSHCRLL